MTTYPNGTKVYTPFPDYEVEDPQTGNDTIRTTYRLAGQIVAVQKKVIGGTSTLYYTYTDHLGNILAYSWTGGTFVPDSAARYDPFGTFTTTPGTNPSITNHGFTGHRHNNTGTYDLGLIYMNARYYLPEVGRFISPDSIVPEPGNPQSFNRYSYSYNNPVNYTDPSGHCTTNYEAGSQDLETCLSAWNSVANFLYGAAFGPGGSGHFPNELVSDWLANADIGLLENLMKSYGIDHGYTYTPSKEYFTSRRSGAVNLRSPEARAEICDYWQSCYQPATDYTVFYVSYFLGIKVFRDDFQNWYMNLHFSSMPSIGMMRGDINMPAANSYKDVADLVVDQRELVVQEALQGWGGGGNISLGLTLGAASNPNNDIFYEGGLSLPGISGECPKLCVNPKSG